MSSIVNKELLDWVEEAYDNYLSNFVTPICPPELDVQPDFYLPMTKEWFIKSLLEDNQRGDIFRQKWGVSINRREMTISERHIEHRANCLTYRNNHGYQGKYRIDNEPKMTEVEYFDLIKIPKQVVTLTYSNKTVTYYE